MTANLPTNVDVPNQLVDATLVPAAAVAAVSSSVVPTTVKTAVAAVQVALLACFSQFDGRTPATGVGTKISTATSAITSASSGATTYGGTLSAWLTAVSAFLTEISTGSTADDTVAVMAPLAAAVSVASPVGGASPDLVTWAEAVTAQFVKIAAANIAYGLNSNTTLAPITVLP